ncbi:MAG: hypothetical protein O2820_19520 [Planctomycetota bacterium]|nr:hypothetical protein [Planctomycetota bacterium]MDA1251406.1 hypothetical protein [Planctomycetota bacterium]
MFPRIRELIGWLLVAGGLFLIKMAVEFVDDRLPINAGVMVMAAATLLRTGMHLVRASVAAEICLSRERSGLAPTGDDR